MKHPWIYEQRPADGYSDWQISRTDLEGPELAIYDSTLPRLANPSQDQLRMLAAYSWIASELKKAAEGDDSDLTLWLRDCMIYARNRLGIAPLHFVGGMDLLLRYDRDAEAAGWPPVYLALDNTWQLLEATR
jgi:hypothetical protein